MYRSPEVTALVDSLTQILEYCFKSKFTDDVVRNRNLLKRFANTPAAASLFTGAASKRVLSDLGLNTPIFCGPVVSHYTAHDDTGSGYGLPFHQDFPSMMSADRSVVIWVSLTDASKNTHSLEIVPRGHKDGPKPGTQEAGGYVLSDQSPPGAEVLEVAKGTMVAMHPWLPHRTFVHPKFDAWKLSLSQRFDDLDCTAWAERDYQNAYSTAIDRTLFDQYTGSFRA